MTTLLDKARAGRSNALANRLSTQSDCTVDIGTRERFLAPRRTESVPFISARARF